MHTIRPWSSGNRVVLVAYSIRDSGKLKADDITLLRDMGFQWAPHLSRPAALRTLRVGLVGKARGVDIQSSVDAQAAESAPAGDLVVEQERDLALSQEEKCDDAEQPSAPLEHVRQDLGLVLQDLEERAARPRDLLEEKEILSEEYRRVGDEARRHLGDA